MTDLCVTHIFNNDNQQFMHTGAATITLFSFSSALCDLLFLFSDRPKQEVTVILNSESKTRENLLFWL